MASDFIATPEVDDSLLPLKNGNTSSSTTATTHPLIREHIADVSRIAANSNLNDIGFDLKSYEARKEANRHCPTELKLKVTDADITVHGYRSRSLATVLLVWLFIVLTFGILGIIILYWRPAWFLKLTNQPCPLDVAEWIYIRDIYNQEFVRRMCTTTAKSLSNLHHNRHAKADKSADNNNRQCTSSKQNLTSSSEINVNAIQNGSSMVKTTASTSTITKHEENIRLLNDQGVVENHDKLRWFHFQKRTYWFDTRTYKFMPLVGPTSFRRSAINTKRGLSDVDAHQRYQLYGKNEITIQVYSYLRILVLEALNPFYIFQAFSITVWLFDHYYIFSFCLLIMSCISLGYTTWQTRRMQQVRHKRFESSGTVLVLRNRGGKGMKKSANNSTQVSSQTINDNSSSTLNKSEKEKSAPNGRLQPSMNNAAPHRRRLSSRMPTGPNVQAINSKELVPGDVILIPQQGCEMYCDAIILNGACIVNESTLTGESVPVTKIASQDDFDDAEEDGEDKRSVSGSVRGVNANQSPEPPACDTAAEDSEELFEDEDDEAQHHVSSERLVYVAPNISGSAAPKKAATNGVGSVGGVEKAKPSSTASSKCVLYAGTTVIQTRYGAGNEPVKAVVMRTGFATVKGELVRSILYPKPVDFLFYVEAYKFLGVLCILASAGLVYSLTILLMRSRSLRGTVLRSLGLITTVVPPTLPLALTLGVVYAQRRLKKAGLFCISPRMINMAGSINLVCFDKTGTLTEEGLNLHGVVPVHDDDDTNNKEKATEPNSRQMPRRRLSNLIAVNHHGNTAASSSSRLVVPTSFVSRKDENSAILVDDYRNAELYRCMATCHALTLIDGKLCGDPLDLEMFQASGWQLDDPDNDDMHTDTQKQIASAIVRPPAVNTTRANNGGEISILRVLPFESHLQRMSVLVSDQQQDMSLYAKGSPEMIASLCVQNTVPENFQDILMQYTEQGFRVLALAHRTFTASDYNENQQELRRTRRSKLECNLNLLGLLVFENRLKPETIGCIQELKNALIRPVMITGDNLLTAISVGRQCGIVDSDSILLYDVAKSNSTPASSPTAKNPNSVMSKLRKTVLTAKKSPNSSPAHRKRSDFYPNPTAEDVEQQNFLPPQCCALTGDTFAVLRTKFRNTEYVNNVLRRGAIFARMSPAQKEALVEDLRHMGGYFVGMCGDGANDCGALRTAHMGISLSDQEASAAAPFTYKHANVSCVPTCIREGRAALDTSFGAFKYMAAYSLTQFFSALILYWLNTNLGAFEFLYIDLFEVTAIISLFGTTHAYSRLVRTTPKTRLIAFGPLASLISQVLLVIFFQMFAFLFVQQQSWYRNIVSENAGYNAASGSHSDESYYSYENYAVYCVSSFQYIWLAVAFSRGFPYRKSIFSNLPLVALCVALATFDVWVTITPCSWIRNMFELAVPESWTFRWKILIISFVNFATAIMLEWWLLAWVNKKLDQRRQKQNRGRSIDTHGVELKSLPGAQATV